MSIDQLAATDSLELLAMFETAAAEAQAAWEEQETEEDRAARALANAEADAYFKQLLADDEERGMVANLFPIAHERFFQASVLAGKTV